MDMAEDDMTMPEYHRWMLKRLEELARATPQESQSILKPLIEHQQAQIAAAEALQEATARIGLTMGYRKSATGAMQPRTHVLHVTTGQRSASSAFWPDVSEHRTRTNIREDQA